MKSIQRSELLGTELFRQNLGEALRNIQSEIIIISAFIKLSGLNWLEQNIGSKKIKCQIMGRFSASDLINGSSDLDIYETISSKKWELKFLNNLHAKIILIDKKYLFIGSPNLTGKGMKLAPISNIEMGIKTIAQNNEIKMVNSLYEEGVLVDQPLYYEIKKWLDNQDKIKSSKIEYTSSILDKLTPNYKIWVYDFPWLDMNDFVEKNENSMEFIHDLELYDLKNNFSKEELIASFKNSKIYKWILKLIKNSENRSMYFGEISKKIHNDLYDDPKPYRKNVKELQSNLYSYIKNINELDLYLTKDTAHSDKIVLKNG